jgi:plastocyanin
MRVPRPNFSNPRKDASTSVNQLRFSVRSVAFLSILLALSVVLAACSSGEEDGGGGGGGNGGGGGTATVENGEVAISADNLEFDVSTIEAPAGEEFTINFTNLESQPHNVALYVEEGGDTIVEGEIVTGPDGTDQVVVPALDPGTYYFQCDVHPDMNGTIVVG